MEVKVDICLIYTTTHFHIFLDICNYFYLVSVICKQIQIKQIVMFCSYSIFYIARILGPHRLLLSSSCRGLSMGPLSPQCASGPTQQTSHPTFGPQRLLDNVNYYHNSIYTSNCNKTLFPVYGT